MCTTSFPPITKTVSSGSETAQFIPFTNWMLAIAANEIKVLIDVIERTTDFEVQLAIQTAQTDTTKPDTPLAKGNVLSVTGKNCSGMIDIKTDVTPKFYVRFGLLVKNASGQGTGFNRGQVMLAVTTRT